MKWYGNIPAVPARRPLWHLREEPLRLTLSPQLLQEANEHAARLPTLDIEGRLHEVLSLVPMSTGLRC